MTNNTLLLVDVQNDFHPGGSLAIPKADEDAERIANFIQKHTKNITRIVETLDTHHELHIAHSGFWVDQNGNHPNPFTTISSADIEKEIWMPWDNLSLEPQSTYQEVPTSVDPIIFKCDQVFHPDGRLDLKKYCVEYTRRLESNGRLQLTIWPDHCILGTKGHNVVSCVQAKMSQWVKANGKFIEWVHKGHNNLTEMYSALQAEVPVTESTSMNHMLVKSLASCDRLFVAGQALSHCVNFTVRDIVANLPKNEVHKIHILTDCCSSVPGCEGVGNDFLNEMKEKGVTLCTSEDVVMS